jgi:hypothetical protein
MYGSNALFILLDLDDDDNIDNILNKIKFVLDVNPDLLSATNKNDDNAMEYELKGQKRIDVIKLLLSYRPDLIEFIKLHDQTPDIMNFYNWQS